MGVVDASTREGKLAAAGALGAAGAAAAALALRRLRRARAEEARGGPRAFRLRPDERLAFGLRRVAAGRIDSALENLRDGELDEVEAVHDARKDLKKLRAVLRLVRPAIGGAAFEPENARYRGAARLLSRTRDAQVRAETVATLAERFGGDTPPGGWDAVIRAAARADTGDLHALRREAAALIEPGRAVIPTLGLPGTDAELLGAGLRRTYARGRRRFREAAADPTDERLHEFRKRAKDLWYDLRLVRDACRPALDSLTDRADRLCDLLGDDQDLAGLSRWLDGGGHGLGADRVAHVERLVGQRRLELQIQAFECAASVYHERPGAFADRVLGYWAAAAPE